MIRTSVVILNFNGENLLRQFLPSVIRHSQQAEIVVADNGSSDQSVAVLRNEFPQVRVIGLDKNYGFCGGYNRALQLVQSEYYVLLNSDVEVTEGWLAPLIEILDRHPSVAAVQPKILSYHQKEKFEYAGAAGGFVDVLGYPFCRGRIFDYVETDSGQYNDEREIFWASGACMIIRSKIFHHLHGFDEDLFAHMEEIDLCWKIHRIPQKVYYSGKSKVYHAGAATLTYENPVKTYLNFRNGLILLFKHFSSQEIGYKLPFRMGLDWVAAFLFLLKGQPKNFASVFRAHAHFIGQWSIHSKKRKELQRTYPAYSRKTIHPGLIIFDYYFLKKKSIVD
jgi:GT2 family glycosyltransferase